MESYVEQMDGDYINCFWNVYWEGDTLDTPKLEESYFYPFDTECSNDGIGPLKLGIKSAWNV